VSAPRAPQQFNGVDEQVRGPVSHGRRNARRTRLSAESGRRPGSAAKPSGRIFSATWRLSWCQWPARPVHAALANEGGDIVVSETGAGAECHNLLRISRLYLSGSDSRRRRAAVTKDRSSNGKGVITPWGRHILYFCQTGK